MSNLITLQQIRNASPCTEGWKKLLKSLDNPSDMGIEVSIGDIAKSNDVSDALWCVRCLPASEMKNVIRAILPSVKRANAATTDASVLKCIKTIESWLEDKATSAELRGAATNAAYAANAANVAYASATNATNAAYAAYASASSAASSAARAAARAASSAATYAIYAADAAYDAAAGASSIGRRQQVADVIAVFPLHAFK